MGTADSLRTALAAAAHRSDRGAAAEEMATLIRSYGSYRWVGIYEVGDHDIYVLGWSGPNAPAVPRFARNQGLCGWAVASRAAVSVDDVTKDPDYLTTLDSTRSEIVMPALSETRQPIGLIDVESEKPAAFSAEDRDLLGACAGAISPLWQR
jgi:L-methionine (R)-S-oxide reductase